MPVYLKGIHDFRQLEQFQSVLIVPCRFCPAASLALRSNEPYFEFFRHLLKTDAYERYIETMKSELEKKGEIKMHNCEQRRFRGRYEKNPASLLDL
jgi:hypothetical protein